MSLFFFPDNTVLVSFAHINRMDLLQSLFKAAARWSSTVQRECRKSAQVAGLEALAQADSILGDPIAPEGDEVSHTFSLRSQLAKPGDGRYEHLGEAETLAIMSSRFSSSAFITDDENATQQAELLGIKVVSTWRVIYWIRLAGLATERETLDFLRDLRHRGAPVLNGITELRSWVTSMAESR